MIITINGVPGSGKSSIGLAVAKKLSYAYYSIGDMRREMAKERGLTLAELNKLGEKEDFTDKEVDDFQKKLGLTKDNIVVNGRLAYHFIPHSIKLFFSVDENIAAKRIMNDKREGEQFKTIEDTIKSIRQRIQSDSIRYKKYYNINPFDMKNYDLIIDTGIHNIEECSSLIVDFVDVRRK